MKYILTPIILTYDDFNRDNDYLIVRHDSNESIDLIGNAIAHSKNIQNFEFQSLALSEAIQGSPVGKKYLRLAEPFLIGEFASNLTDELNRQVYILPSLDKLPSVTLLDYVLGLEYCVKFSGCCIGIDIAVSPEQAGKKLRQKRELERVYSSLHLDRIVILCLKTGFDSLALEHQLEKVVKCDNLIQIIDF